MGSRYDKLFAALREKNEGAFVPFIMLGDPTPEASLDIIRNAVAAGADALELGVPFSDPVADGPTIQASHIRALDGGATLDSALDQVQTIRTEFPDLPIGMLIYGNVAFARGVEQFYAEFAEAGADSILLPDVPVREGAPFIAAAKEAGIDPIFIAPARAAEQVGVADSARPQRLHQRLGDVLLADDVGERLGAVAAVEGRCHGVSLVVATDNPMFPGHAGTGAAATAHHRGGECDSRTPPGAR